MKIKQFRYSADNLGYLVYGETKALAIDGGAVDNMLSFLKSKNLELVYVINTHTHSDHTMGNNALLKQSNAEFLIIETLLQRKNIQLEKNTIQILHTPGHTDDSITFHFDNILVTGDTLFNGKAGRCFSGNFEGFLVAIKKLMTFPGDTIVYAGHDYVEEYMDFAKSLEPDNPHIRPFLEHYNPDHVYSTLDQEMKINPHLRFNDEKIIALLEQRGLGIKTEQERWMSLLSIE